MIKSTGVGFFTFYATTGAEKCNHQLVVATTGAFTLTSVVIFSIKSKLPKAVYIQKHPFSNILGLRVFFIVINQQVKIFVQHMLKLIGKKIITILR